MGNLGNCLNGFNGDENHLSAMDDGKEFHHVREPKERSTRHENRVDREYGS